MVGARKNGCTGANIARLGHMGYDGRRVAVEMGGTVLGMWDALCPMDYYAQARRRAFLFPQVRAGVARGMAERL